MQKKEAVIYPLFSLPLMAMSLDIDNDKMLNADGVEDETVGQQWLETHNNWPAQMWIQTSYNTINNTHNSAVNAGASPIGDSQLAVVVFFTQDAKGFLGQKILLSSSHS